MEELITLLDVGIHIEDVSKARMTLAETSQYVEFYFGQTHDMSRYNVMSKLQTEGHRAYRIGWDELDARYSKSLHKMIYDKNFKRQLPKNHEYQTTMEHRFDGPRSTKDQQDNQSHQRFYLSIVERIESPNDEKNNTSLWGVFFFFLARPVYEELFVTIYLCCGNHWKVKIEHFFYCIGWSLVLQIVC